MQTEMSIYVYTDGNRVVLYQEHDPDGGTNYSRFESDGSFKNGTVSMFGYQVDGTFTDYRTEIITLNSEGLGGITKYTDFPGSPTAMDNFEMSEVIANELQGVTNFVSFVEANKVIK